MGASHQEAIAHPAGPALDPDEAFAWTTERAPVPNPTTIMYDVIATMYDVIATLPTQCGSHACMVVLHAYARRHCMSTARVSAIPTPRSVTCRGRFIVPGVTNPLGYRTHVGSSAEVASARQGRRPPAAHIAPHAPSQSAPCVIIVITHKKTDNGSPGHGCTWGLALPLRDGEARRGRPNCTARCARWPNPVGPTNDNEDANSNDDDGTMTTMLG